MARNHGRGAHRALNLNVRGLGYSATVAINERIASLRAAGREIFQLGFGQSPFPVPEPVAESLRRNAHQKDYLPVKGLEALRRAVADYTRRVFGVDRNASDVLIGPGSKELMFLLQLVYYGDLVIPAPSWVSYAPQARIIGRHVRLLETTEDDGWAITPEQLDRLCAEDPERPRIVILNYPSNPTGGSYPLARLKALARVAREHGVVLLADEIYGELHHRGQHVSIARFYPEGTIVSSGLSKWCGAGGWRLGTFVFPPRLGWLLDAMAAVASETYTSTSAPIQYAAVTAFEGGPEIDDYLRRSRRVLGWLGRWCWRRLAACGVVCCRPAGGFYLFPSFEQHRPVLAAAGIDGSLALCEALLDDTGVALLPGEPFGLPPSLLAARLAYVDFDGAAALAAAGGISTRAEVESFLRRYCPRVMTAVERLGEWLVERRAAG
ncbi:MAG: aminotransferase class I/II-fold pyridoxal phosphate-dependent enzyme [Acidobacteria bacterium]|nr:MAG: aminotransferase class I/II-fold pyridoxal phosphate-dependent enzyme [Acidobacteriota bacterium]